MRAFAFTLFSLAMLTLSSCTTSRTPRVTERIINVGRVRLVDTVQIAVSRFHVLLDRQDVVKVLQRELKHRLKPEVANEKQRILMLLENEAGKKTEFTQYGGLVTVCEALLKNGRGIIYDMDGNEIREIILRKEHLLFGSYKEALMLPDGQELIITKIRLGE